MIKHDSEEILFYYMKLVGELKVPLKKQGINPHENLETVVELLNIVKKVTSLSVVRSFYQLVLNNEIYIN